MIIYTGTSWDKRINDRLDRHLDIDETLTHNGTVKFLVKKLSDRGISFSLVNLGAGVKRITTKDTHICPKCNGTGRC